MSETLRSDFTQIPDGMDGEGDPYFNKNAVSGEPVIQPFGVDFMSEALPLDANSLGTKSTYEESGGNDQ